MVHSNVLIGCSPSWNLRVFHELLNHLDDVSIPTEPTQHLNQWRISSEPSMCLKHTRISSEPPVSMRHTRISNEPFDSEPKNHHQRISVDYTGHKSASREPKNRQKNHGVQKKAIPGQYAFPVSNALNLLSWTIFFPTFSFSNFNSFTQTAAPVGQSTDRCTN